MKILWGNALSAAVLALLAAPARAADIPVSYTVEGTILKGAAAGTSLAFSLYSDAGCASLVHSQNVLIEDVTLAVQLKRFKPKDAPKPAKTVELRHNLTGVSSTGPFYLSVSGTGVTPVGPACQPQAAAGGGGGPSLNLYSVFEPITVPASGTLRQSIECNPGDLATGGGYFLSASALTDAQRDVEVFSDAPISDLGLEGTGWDIGIKNKTTTQRTGLGYAVCADLTP